ncbi:MAG TPA: amino acid ABC transporter permease [Terrimicrobiaceae bacterium]
MDTLLGTVVASLRVSPFGSFRALAAIYTEVLRNTPLTLVFFFCAFVLPKIGVILDFQFAAIVALTVYTAPFIAEALRSGINGVPVGQAEAARSIGLRFDQVLILIVLPQAFRMVIPPLMNVFIALTKNTSVAGGFFVFELFSVGKRLANAHGSAVIPILLGVACFYLLITVPLGQLSHRLEAKVALAR